MLNQIRIRTIGVGVFVLLMISSIGCKSIRKATGPNTLDTTAPELAKGLKNVQAEEVKLEFVAVTPEGHTSETLAFAAALPYVEDVLKGTLKFLARQGGQLMSDYAATFGATYSAKAVQSNFDRDSQSNRRYYFIFRRTLLFASQNDATNAFGFHDWLPGTVRTNVNKQFEVDAVSIPIVLETTVKRQTSWRFIDIAATNSPGTNFIDVASAELLRTNWPYSTNIMFQARKANALTWGDKIDDFKAAITVTIKEHAMVDGREIKRVTDPVGITLAARDFGKQGSRRSMQSDWMACPAGEAFSIEVSVIESSRLKDWIEKTGKKLQSYAEKEIEKIDLK